MPAGGRRGSVRPGSSGNPIPEQGAACRSHPRRTTSAQRASSTEEPGSPRNTRCRAFWRSTSSRVARSRPSGWAGAAPVAGTVDDAEAAATADRDRVSPTLVVRAGGVGAQFPGGSGRKSSVSWLDSAGRRGTVRRSGRARRRPSTRRPGVVVTMAADPIIALIDASQHLAAWEDEPAAVARPRDGVVAPSTVTGRRERQVRMCSFLSRGPRQQHASPGIPRPGAARSGGSARRHDVVRCQTYDRAASPTTAAPLGQPASRSRAIAPAARGSTPVTRGVPTTAARPRAPEASIQRR
jgi:hypothetical protein